MCDPSVAKSVASGSALAHSSPACLPHLPQRPPPLPTEQSCGSLFISSQQIKTVYPSQIPAPSYALSTSPDSLQLALHEVGISGKRRKWSKWKRRNDPLHNAPGNLDPFQSFFPTGSWHRWLRVSTALQAQRCHGGRQISNAKSIIPLLVSHKCSRINSTYLGRPGIMQGRDD